MNKNIIESVKLENGLTLEILDQSRKVAADSYFVRLVSRVEIPVEEKWFENDHNQWTNVKELSKKLGQTVIFEQKHERKFVESAKKKDVVTELTDRLVESGTQYLSLPQFPRKVILKKYMEMSKSADISSQMV